MRNRKSTSKAVRGARAIAIVSVALVLLILGTMGLTAFTAHHVTTDLRQRLGFVVVVDDEGGKLNPDSLRAVIAGRPHTASVVYRPAEEVQAQWLAEMGAEGEIISDLGVNPFLPEFDVRVNEAWSSPDSLKRVADAYSELPWVYDVHVHTAIIGNVNATINTAMAVMTVMAVALLLISFALINNTVRLTIHARRFAIQTMKYVGATDGFITRPIVGESTLHGVLAAAEASIVLIAAVFYFDYMKPGIIAWITWEGIAWTVCGMFAAGALLCAVTSWLATRKYLRKHYEDLF